MSQSVSSANSLNTLNSDDLDYCLKYIVDNVYSLIQDNHDKLSDLLRVISKVEKENACFDEQCGYFQWIYKKHSHLNVLKIPSIFNAAADDRLSFQIEYTDDRPLDDIRSQQFRYLSGTYGITKGEYLLHGYMYSMINCLHFTSPSTKDDKSTFYFNKDIKSQSVLNMENRALYDLHFEAQNRLPFYYMRQSKTIRYNMCKLLYSQWIPERDLILDQFADRNDYDPYNQKIPVVFPSQICHSIRRKNAEETYPFESEYVYDFFGLRFDLGETIFDLSNVEFKKRLCLVEASLVRFLTYGESIYQSGSKPHLNRVTAKYHSKYQKSKLGKNILRCRKYEITNDFTKKVVSDKNEMLKDINKLIEENNIGISNIITEIGEIWHECCPALHLYTFDRTGYGRSVKKLKGFIIKLLELKKLAQDYINAKAKIAEPFYDVLPNGAFAPDFHKKNSSTYYNSMELIRSQQVKVVAYYLQVMTRNVTCHGIKFLRNKGYGSDYCSVALKRMREIIKMTKLYHGFVIKRFKKRGSMMVNYCNHYLAANPDQTYDFLKYYYRDEVGYVIKPSLNYDLSCATKASNDYKDCVCYLMAAYSYYAIKMHTKLKPELIPTDSYYYYNRSGFEFQWDRMWKSILVKVKKAVVGSIFKNFLYVYVDTINTKVYLGTVRSNETGMALIYIKSSYDMDGPYGDEYLQYKKEILYLIKDYWSKFSGTYMDVQNDPECSRNFDFLFEIVEFINLELRN